MIYKTMEEIENITIEEIDKLHPVDLYNWVEISKEFARWDNWFQGYSLLNSIYVEDILWTVIQQHRIN